MYNQDRGFRKFAPVNVGDEIEFKADQHKIVKTIILPFNI